MASLTSGEMTHADWLRSTLVCIKNLSHLREQTASIKYFMGLSKLFKKNKTVESLLTATMKTVDMRDAKGNCNFSIFTTVLNLYYHKLATFIDYS